MTSCIVDMILHSKELPFQTATEAQEPDVKTVQNSERRHNNDVNDIVLLFLLLIVNILHTMF